jgi:hypothetical protein
VAHSPERCLGYVVPPLQGEDAEHPPTTIATPRFMRTLLPTYFGTTHAASPGWVVSGLLVS